MENGACVYIYINEQYIACTKNMLWLWKCGGETWIRDFLLCSKNFSWLHMGRETYVAYEFECESELIFPPSNLTLVDFRMTLSGILEGVVSITRFTSFTCIQQLTSRFSKKTRKYFWKRYPFTFPVLCCILCDDHTKEEKFSIPTRKKERGEVTRMHVQM